MTYSHDEQQQIFVIREFGDDTSKVSGFIISLTVNNYNPFHKLDFTIIGG